MKIEIERQIREGIREVWRDTFSHPKLQPP
jgi:hypothetical protein